MAGNEMICYCLQVDYASIRKAMVAGARTIEDIQEMTGAATGCGGCKGRIEEILASACSCKQVPLADVVKAVNDGATTVAEVNEKTTAGTGCQRCNALIENVIEQKR